HEHRRISLNELIRQATKSWHGVKPEQPDWSDHSHSLAFETVLRNEGVRAYLILNAYWEALAFELPPAGGTGTWHRWIAPALDSPQDIVAWQTAPSLSGPVYHAAARSVVVLFAEAMPPAAAVT